jgi:septal ring factor EnvC (AmiA/AmiB activator)
MIKYLRVILDKDLMLIRQASREHQDFKQQVSVVEKKIKTISDIKEEESNNISSLKAELEKKVILLSRVHKEKEFYETAVIELGSAAEGLKNTITDLDNRENKKKDKTTVLPSGFADLKGKLPLPVKGKIIKGNRQSGENIFNSLKGVYISGSFGADVKSIYQGRVDYSGQLKGYGQVVVINHGERFFTISAYLARRNKNEGDIVEKGEKIGQIGETGLLAGPALYFEMRKGDTNLDPLKWLKVD